MYIKLQSTVDIVIRKTLNLAYVKFAQTCSSLGRPLKKKPAELRTKLPSSVLMSYLL